MVETTSTNGVHHATDEAIDLLYSWMPPQPPPQGCPEACFSLTLKGTVGGHEALLTARGQTAAEFTAHVAAIKGVLDPVQATPQASSTAEGWCSKHGLAMTLNQKAGRPWWSHRLENGSWCKGGAR